MIFFQKMNQIMRNKIPEEQKKVSVTFTINPALEKLLKQKVKDLGINKSKFIETLLEDKLKKE